MLQKIRFNGKLPERILSRRETGGVEEAVRAIIKDVKENGDAAVIKYTKKFDIFDLDKNNILVSESEFAAAYRAVKKSEIKALEAAKKSIVSYNEKIKRKDVLLGPADAKTGYICRPMERVGLYVPGGKAAYPSSVLMCALPAVVAGVKEIIICTPAPGGAAVNPLTLVAADLCGVKKVYKIGGAQAVAAMAYGTGTVPRVDLITGPGNIYVATAKKEIFGAAGIDMVAGPSEIAVIADSGADPSFIAADLLSQAEHDELAMSVLITPDEALADKVNAELEKQIKALNKEKIAAASLSSFGTVILCKDLYEAAEASNLLAPEHLELCVDDPDALLSLITSAGAVFMGNYTPEALGDYAAGPNHVLPTNGTARFFSALSVDTYIKKISVIKYGRAALQKKAETIITLAENEGLKAHAESVRIRIQK